MDLYINATDPAHDLELGIFRSDAWEFFFIPRAKRGGVLKALTDWLREQKIEWVQVRILFVLMGRGSFTATRSIATIANALALAGKVKVRGITKFDQLSPDELIKLNPETGRYILPSYSMPPRIGPKSL